MCGIFAVLKKQSPTPVYDYIEKFKSLATNLFINSEGRGSDSSGVIVVHQPYEETAYCNVANKKEDCGKVFVHKAPIRASKYVSSEEYVSLLKKVDEHTSAIIGHTRAATTGTARDNVNNHPHICGSIIGVHNGVISNWREVAKKLDIQLKSQCDSEIIFACINKFKEQGKSLQEAIIETSSYIQGWYSCIVVDTTSINKVAFFRKRAPLFVRLKDYSPSSMILASEECIITESYSKIYGDKDKKLYYIELAQLQVPDNSGYVLDYTDDKVSSSINMNDVAKKATPFELK